MLFPYLLKVSLVLATLTLAYRWLIQFETFSKLNRVLLWFNVTVAWLLPFTPLPDWGPVEVQRQFHQTLPEIRTNIPISAPVSLIPARSVASAPLATGKDPALANWLLIGYLAGLLIVAVRFLTQLTNLGSIIVGSDRRRRSDGVVLVSNPETVSPFSFFRWIVYNPSRYSAGELGHILAHEAEHVKQHHSIDLLISEIQRILLWFNPFAWYHRRLVQANLEYLADKAVLNSGFEKKRYQYDLLNAVMRTRELPLTSSFAQSLLKKRIKMMNRKPSHYWVWGKYLAVLALIYISSAFVAPFRERLVAMAPPEMRPFVKPLVNEVIMPEVRTMEIPDEAEQKAAGSEVKPDPKANLLLSDTTQINQEQEKRVKGVLIRNDTLYWAITPMMNWDDINVVREVVHKFGAELAVNKLQYDPLQKFITSVSVMTRSSGNGSSGSGSRAGDDDFSPTKGYSGYILQKGLGMGQLPPAPLANELNEDYEKATMIKKKNEVAYFEYKLVHQLKGPCATSGYPQRMLSDKLFELQGIGKSLQNTLKVAYKLDNSEFYLNTQPATRNELNEIPIDQVEKVNVIEEKGGKKYYIIYTK